MAFNRRFPFALVLWLVVSGGFALPSADAQEGNTAGVVTASLADTTEKPERISQFSGLPVPRLASLRYNEVNGRTGPSLDYPIAWFYERRGLPVVVIRESTDWRKVRDPAGDEVWVHKRMLADRPTSMIRVPAALCKRAKPRCREIAMLEPGVVVEVEACGPDWCETFVDDRRGWTPRDALWGAELLAANE